MTLIALALGVAAAQGLDAGEEAGPAVGREIAAPADVPDAGSARVAGGRITAAGAWPDAVGVSFGSYVGCTGTLIAPDVVLTAGHCAGGIRDVVVGDDWTRADAIVGVRQTVAHPNWQGTFDVAVLLLEREVTGVAPRPLAVDCVVEDLLSDGADVAVVGFGNTDYAGDRNTTRKHEGFTQVSDADCSQGQIDGFASGCNAGARPAGEIAAGGNDVDSCFGDSGGPLYLLGADDRAYLVGVTSRSYAGVPNGAPCRYGGIYTRPDAVLDWIEDVAGPVALPTCNHRPEVVDDEVRVVGPTDVPLVFDDADPAPDARWRIVTPPRHGEATLRGDVLRYVPDPGFEGEDAVGVELDDGGNPEWPRTGSPLADQGTVRLEVHASPGSGGDGPGAGGTLEDDPGAAAEIDPAVGYRRMGCATGGGVGGLGVILVAAAASRRSAGGRRAPRPA